MKKVQNHLILILLGLSVSCTQKRTQKPTENQSENTVHFPEVSEPIQLIDNGKEHLYASYYGINSFSADQKYATVLETDIKYRLPTENDPATYGRHRLRTIEN